MQLTDKELFILQDTDFLLTKATALVKIQELLAATKKSLEIVVHSTENRQQTTDNSTFSFPEGTKFNGKISKGENYRQLPYFVLDYPTLFDNDHIFAYRVMFWWGHFFSFTLHLQGRFLQQYRTTIVKNLDLSDAEKTYISVGETPWEYHYEPDNYQLLSQLNKTSLFKKDFLKISQKIELEEWKELPEKASEFLERMLSLM